MDARPTPRVALMAIQPRFSQAILAGDKRVEFRKRTFAPDIETVLIYESAPTQRIVGRFTIDRTAEASPRELWREFGAVGGIPRREFLAYYAGHTKGVGFVVKAVERYERPVSLQDLSSSPSVPQSFVYLPGTAVDEIRQLQPRHTSPPLQSLVGRLLQHRRCVLVGGGSR